MRNCTGLLMPFLFLPPPPIFDFAARGFTLTSASVAILALSHHTQICMCVCRPDYRQHEFRPIEH